MSCALGQCWDLEFIQEMNKQQLILRFGFLFDKNIDYCNATEFLMDNMTYNCDMYFVHGICKFRPDKY